MIGTERRTSLSAATRGRLKRYALIATIVGGAVGGFLLVQLVRSHPDDGVIYYPGTYPCKSGKLALVVAVSSSNIVEYKILERSTGQQLVASNAGSVYQRWFFLWDDTDSLWVHSSDIGGTVWVGSVTV